MAKPQVTLTLAGDSSQLEKTFESVGASSREMGDEVDTASSRVGQSSQSFDRAGDAADRMDSKAMGFRDTMTGVQDSMLGVSEIARGNMFEGFINLGRGVGDLASGFANFLIPQIRSFSKAAIANTVATVRNTAAMAVQRTTALASAAATRVMTVAQRALNWAMRANPIGLIITLIAGLVAGIVIAYKRSQTFRNIVQGAMRGIQAAFGWVIDRGGDLVNWFRKLPGRIGSFFSGLGSSIAQPFQTAFAAVRAAWNSTIGGRGFTIPGWVPGIGGRSFRIPTFHSGGVVPGAPGTETMARLQAGERVTPAGQSAPPVVLELRSGGSRMDDMLLEMLRRSVRVRGGNVQVVLGGRS